MKINTSDIMAEFKAKQNLINVSQAKRKDITKGYNKRPKKDTYNPYTSYKAKLEQGKLDKFSTRDISYFFRDVANENGVKYVISNIAKDSKCYKLCIERGYTTSEILTMIEFLFTSGQPYLRVETLQPTILISSWCNTIYADSQLWLKDEYDPNKKYNKNKKKSPNREWVGEVPEEDKATIGDWGF